jgi:hypothetical protein
LGIISCIKKISHKSVDAVLSKLEHDTSSILKNIKEIRENVLCFESSQENHPRFPAVSISQKTVFIDGIQIISERAHLQSAIFKILINHHKEHYFERETIFLKTQKILEHLVEIKPIGVKIKEIDPMQVMQAIDKIKSVALKKLNCEIILSERWKGYAIASNISILKGGIDL